MKSPCFFPVALSAVVLSITAARSEAQSVLVLNGTGISSISSSIAAAGFTVISGTFDPGQISSRLSVPNNIVEIWIWSDNTYGQTGVPADPLRDFDAADLLALDAFHAAHPHWIMDGLAWRLEGTPDEIALTMNEALALNAAGGGIVLGADDASGDAIVQHVNQVGARYGFLPFEGTFDIQSNQHLGAGPLLSTPSAVTVTNMFSTGSYCDVPHGLQPNGLVLATALASKDALPDLLYVSPTLGTEVFGGQIYDDFLHLITTTLHGTLPGTTAGYCFGDGSATLCPCSNFGVSGHGCENSSLTGGGMLASSGTPSVSADSFALDGADMPASGAVLYFQGTDAMNLRFGIVFGDGLLCVGGSLTRLAVRFNSAGASSYGAPLGDVPISIDGLIPAGGGTHYYQGWYRDAVSFCSASTFNLTNGLAVTWVP